MKNHWLDLIKKEEKRKGKLYKPVLVEPLIIKPLILGSPKKVKI